MKNQRIVHRLMHRKLHTGRWGIIDRIGEAFCESPDNPVCVENLQSYRAFRMRCLATTLGIVDRCKAPNNIIVSVRLKRLDSIRRKLIRTRTNFTLGRLDDVIGVRVICQSLQDVLEFSSRIGQVPGSRLKNYVIKPTKTGYRGVHGILAFAQPAGNGIELRARFEIQIRTHLQHLWAVWSESHGDAVKIGTGESDEHRRLCRKSKKIAKWESDNCDLVQHEYPEYAGGRSLVVCWRPPHGPPTPYYFGGDVNEAVNWLNYLEERHPERRREALLLVGVNEDSSIEQLIQTTHPLFAGVRVLDPVHWIPDISLN